MTDETDSTAADDLVAARGRLEALRSRLDATGLDRSELETVADAYRGVETVLERWEERATDWDDFEGYVKFRDDLAETLESIPDDVPEREAFLEADEHVTTGGVSKSLRAGDFDAAREALAPAREYADLRADLESALEERRGAERRAERRREELRERIETLEGLLELGEADLDAPTERLEEPIRAYDDTIEDAFGTFRQEAPAAAFLGFVERAAHTPFVDYESPPENLLEYVRTRAAGEYSVAELLEFADYSTSKLSHYVDDAALLKRRVATNRAYLERLSAAPLSIGWPPESAGTLRFRIEELLGLVGTVADDSAVSTLREIRELTRAEAYERIREAARADAELADEQRRKLERGELETECSAAREELERLEALLSE
ncbi:uncharacterized protein Nmlp_3280 [Natronomonas moolapensis 8.8.11]|uniref:Uncharacterized protein n=1 Tax=Natronomonas moolapensis (strain DSM 18674 / CECT 7526 / JCM 14361 / 8.8.11) TaxID=268739 RepID=M1XLB4_NATM8|nr:hypothetical protein [Natronomonas moolapensis]CCQ37414.1 uncharacterized protein Nmlp_3280 [Natronomonas moolapensis 8.8.11]